MLKNFADIICGFNSLRCLISQCQYKLQICCSYLKLMQAPGNMCKPHEWTHATGKKQSAQLQKPAIILNYGK